MKDCRERLFSCNHHQSLNLPSVTNSGPCAFTLLFSISPTMHVKKETHCLGLQLKPSTTGARGYSTISPLMLQARQNQAGQTLVQHITPFQLLSSGSILRRKPPQLIKKETHRRVPLKPWMTGARDFSHATTTN